MTARCGRFIAAGVGVLAALGLTTAAMAEPTITAKGEVCASKASCGQTGKAKSVTCTVSGVYTGPTSTCPTTTSAPAIDPRVIDVITKWVTFSRTVQSISVEVDESMEMTVDATAQPAQMRRFTVAFERPNHWALRGKMRSQEAISVCDGTTLSAYLDGKYAQMPAPATAGQLLQMREAFTTSSLGVALATGFARLDTLSTEEIVKGVTDGMASARYLGVETIDGVPAHHIFSCNSSDNAMDVWIAEGDQPHIVRSMIDYGKITTVGPKPGATSQPVVKNVQAISYHNWKINTPIPAETFAFTPPKDAKKVDSLFPKMEDQCPSLKTKGQPAPEFVAAKLTGGAMSLKSHLGKDVIVLDFWATWCGPCRQALPIVEKVTKAFADRGVVFYAIDSDEESAKVRECLKKLSISEDYVLMDKNDVIGKLYRVTGIPQTVIIGRDGKILDVHIGSSPTMEKELTAQLESAIAAKPTTQPAKTSKASVTRPATSGSAKTTDVKAIEFLDRLKTYADQIRNASVDIEMTQEIVSGDGSVSRRTMLSTMIVEKPNCAKLAGKISGGPFLVACDGTTLGVYANERYVELSAPPTLRRVVDFPETDIAIGAAQILAVGSIDSETFGRLAQSCETTYVGIETIDGVRVHHLCTDMGLSTSGVKEAKWHLWFAEGPSPNLIRVEFRAVAKSAEMPVSQTTCVYKNWQVNQPIAAETFKFVPPAGAKKVRSFFGAE